MKYYSEKTKKVYDTVVDLTNAEHAEDERLKKLEEERAAKAKAEAEKKAARSADAKRVEEAYTKYRDAYKEYTNVLDKFCKEHGAFHMSISEPISFNGLLDSFLNLF